jgi:5S rRNA maturation endonuclease (ribonuclease M5)
MDTVKEFTAHAGLTPKTLAYYNCQDLYNSDSELVGHRYYYPSGDHKDRIFPKTFRTNPGFSSASLFGMDKFNAGGNELVITEGEKDAMSVYQMLSLPAVSLPSATPSHKFWSNEELMSYLKSFKRIYCSFDSDGKSDPIRDKLVAIFPNKVFEIQHTKYKDANEFLTNKAIESFRSAYRNAQKVTPDYIWNTSEDLLKILDENHSDNSIPTGIEELDNRIEGLIRGYLYVIQAPEGTGKTEIIRYLEYNLIRNYSVPTAVMHLEETRQRYILGLASYELNTNVTRKSNIPEELMGDVRRVIQEIGDAGNLYLFEMSESENPSDILDKIRYMAVALGVQYFFFEPIQDLSTNRPDGQTEEQFLTWLSTKLAWLAQELNIAIITVAHENDDGQIRSCRMIGKRAGVVIKAVRDKDAPEDVRDITQLLIEKNRPLGYRGYGGSLKFDGDSFTLYEHTLIF